MTEDTKNLSPPQPRVLSLYNVLLTIEMEKVCWLDYLKLLVWVQKLISPFLKGVGSSDAFASTPWFREARKLRGDSAEGEPKAVPLSCPTQVSQAHSIFPGSLLPVILGAAASFWDHLCLCLSLSLSLSLSPLGSSPSLLTPPQASQNLGEMW